MSRKGQFKKGNAPWNKGQTKYPKLNSNTWLYQKYWVEEMSQSQIAKVVGCSNGAVWAALERLDVSCRSISNAVKGKIPWNKGLTKESDERVRKISEANIGKQHTEETIQKLREARKHIKMPKIDTKPELIFIEFYKKFGLESQVEDTRNNSFHIGRLNPDFIIRDMKIAIFINGDYWHSALLRYNIRYTQRPEKQIKECKKHKWKAIILWEADLKRIDAEQFVLSVLKNEKII